LLLGRVEQDLDGQEGIRRLVVTHDVFEGQRMRSRRHVCRVYLPEDVEGLDDSGELLLELLHVSVRDTDARQIISNVEDTARRQPLIFIGGAFLLGLAASRLIKAGSPDKDQAGQFMQSNYRTGYQGSDSFEAIGPGTGNGYEAS